MTSRERTLIVLAAGGSGGHVFPADALANELTKRGCRLTLLTDRRGGAFSGFLTKVETHRVLAGGIAGKSFARRLQSAPELAIGAWQAWRLLKRLRPAAVIGFGGYASIPTMLAACFGGYPTAIHEQNAVLGRANRVASTRPSTPYQGPTQLRILVNHTLPYCPSRTPVSRLRPYHLRDPGGPAPRVPTLLPQD